MFTGTYILLQLFTYIKTVTISFFVEIHLIISIISYNTFKKEKK